jgi:hypothetical protein
VFIESEQGVIFLEMKILVFLEGNDYNCYDFFHVIDVHEMIVKTLMSSFILFGTYPLLENN